MKIKAYIRRYPLYSYFIMTFGIAWIGSIIVAGPAFLRGEVISAQYVMLMLLFMLAGPSIAGILLMYLSDGREGLRSLFRRMLKWNSNLKWYGFALLIPPVLILFTLYTLSELVSPIYAPGFFALGITYGLLAGYFEEIGWMGFAYGKMKKRVGTLKAAIFLGLVWGTWHLVAGFLGSFTTLGVYWLPNFLALWIIGMTATRVLIVWIYENTQSILLCQLMHASSTGLLAVFSPTSDTPAQETLWFSVYAVMLWIVVFFILFVYGRNLNNNLPTPATIG